MSNVKLNKSASRVMDILVLLSREDQPLTVSEISRELNVPKSSTFEILTTMVEKGFLQVDDHLKTYKLGLKLFEVGAAYLYNTDLHKEARPYLETLMTKTGETAFLAIESDGEVVYLDKVEAPSSIRTTATLGNRNPMYRTGLGKAILAGYSDDKVRELMGNTEFIQRTSNSITSYNSLIENLNQIRQRGYSIDDRENEEDVFCIAAPVYDESNRPVAAISVAGLATRMKDDEKDKYSEFLVETALGISKRLGYRNDRLFIKN
ncbi:IclR family transcriptional regulator [Peribacillus aracenensis]|uniref:IclR family transcriptional regulator n=1 Tax=Peribacillus aracenensis TaxID=2976708 RepID=UPI0021A95F20|nr:IclR family transcriptional regulator [Peribacillus sp. BBB004]